MDISSSGGLDLDQSLLQYRSGQDMKAIDKKFNPDASDKEIKKVSKDFEKVFISNMLGPIFKNFGDENSALNGDFDGGFAEKTYRSLLVDEYAGAIADQGGFGIAEQVHKELLKIQEDRKNKFGRVKQ